MLGIRSERRLCEEVHLNLAYRWFCRLGLEHAVPEHSTFSKNRHGRFRESETFRHVFETVLSRCIDEGLVSGEGFAIDASVVKADANCQRGVASTQSIDWSKPEFGTRAVRVLGLSVPALPLKAHCTTGEYRRISRCEHEEVNVGCFISKPLSSNCGSAFPYFRHS